tara:strand:+ start:21969 stop:23735 length:1767 start_codon:yes stop_codon:yes gene_type:complete
MYFRPLNLAIAMQRCFFLLIFSTCFFSLRAQEIDILAIELSLWLDEKIPEKIHARSLLTIRKNQALEVQLDFESKDIKYIKLREGRLKRNLKFKQSGTILKIETASINTLVCDIEIDYLIDLNSKNLRENIDRERIRLAFNMKNVIQGNEIGKSGLFFPGRPYDPFSFKANITLPRKINCGLPAQLEYVVNHNKIQSQFWASKNEITSEQFYFVLGDFLEFDELEFQEELILESVSFEERLAEESKQSMLAVINYIKAYDPISEMQELKASEILEIDSLAAINKDFLWVKEENTNIRWADKQFVRDQILFLRAAHFDSSRAALWHLEYLAQKESQAWKLEFLEEQWDLWKQGKSKNQKLALLSSVLDWLKVKDSAAYQRYITKDFANGESQEWKIAQTIIANNRIPELELQYFYKNERENLVIIQKDSLKQAIPVYYKFKVFDREGMEIYSGISRAVHFDTISFPQKGAPRAVIFEYEENFPARFILPKSDNYDMFLFANGENDKQKRQALFRLFETKNRNLYSTVLGLAMDSKEAEIRLEAVNRAEVLGLPGQQKLKSIIMDLAQYDKDPEVRKQAKLLVRKYYGHK